MPHMDLKRAQGLMKQRGVDALVASTQDNFYYASGYRAGIAEWCPMMTIVPANPSLVPTVIVSAFVEWQARQQAYVKDVRSYPAWMPIIDVDGLIEGTAKKAKDKPHQFSLEHVFGVFSDVLREKSLRDGVIGLEKKSIQDPEIYSILSRQNPKAKFVEADDIFWELRKVKTEDEIKVLRVAADLAVKGLQAVIKGGVLGATIGELHLRYKKGIVKSATPDNAMDLQAMRLYVSSGDHFSTTDNPGYQVAKGDVIWTDNGVTVFGYTSDIGRTFIVGRPSELQKKLFAALRTGFEEAVLRVKPGVKMKEIHRVLQETVNKSGFEWYARGHMGHSVGIGPPEQPPFVSADEETELEPNMVICVECGAYILGRFGAFQIEDMFLITPEGHEVLTKLPRDMVEL